MEKDKVLITFKSLICSEKGNVTTKIIGQNKRSQNVASFGIQSNQPIFHTQFLQNHKIVVALNSGGLTLKGKLWKIKTKFISVKRIK